MFMLLSLWAYELFIERRDSKRTKNNRIEVTTRTDITSPMQPPLGDQSQVKDNNNFGQQQSTNTIEYIERQVSEDI